MAISNQFINTKRSFAFYKAVECFVNDVTPTANTAKTCAKGKHFGHLALLFIGTFAPKYAIFSKFQYRKGLRPLPVSQKVTAMAKRLLTPEIKDGILEAFEQAGGVDYLVELSKVDPPTFCRLLIAIIPSEIKADIQTTHRLDLAQAMLEGNQRLASIEHKE